MLTNGLSLSQCDLSKNQIAVPSASNLNTQRSLTITSRPVIEADSCIKVGVRGSNEIEINEVESQMEIAKSSIMIFC